MALDAVSERLFFVIDRRLAGIVYVESRTPRKVLGQFTPGAGLDPYRSVFETAVTLARE
jgi:hypothetical protein